MNERADELDAQGVRDLFQELSERLQARGLQAQLFVVGGAAMALAYDRARLTRDVDALFVPPPEVRELAEEISDSRGLEPDWLNDAARGLLPGADEHPRTVFESESLLVQVPSPQYLLAMNLHAPRDERDLDDAAILFNDLGYTTAQECIDLLTARYPATQLLPATAEDVARRAGVGTTGPRRANPGPSLSSEASGPDRGLPPPEWFGGPEQSAGTGRPPPRRPGQSR